MKYFLDCDYMALYAVPKKYWYLIDIIKDGTKDDDEVNEAAHQIKKNCKIKLWVSALTQTL